MKNKRYYIFEICTLALYAEQILNKIANTFDGTYAGLKNMLQRFRKYFFLKSRIEGRGIYQLGSTAD